MSGISKNVIDVGKQNLTNMTIGIHQPNYLPWIGYFNKMKQCDKFVIFDDVQLPLGKNFETRTSIKTNQGPFELVLPIRGKTFNLMIKDAEIDGVKWRKNHLRTLELAYSKSLWFDNYYPFLKALYVIEWHNLRELNVEIIKDLAKMLKIKSEIILSSDLKANSQGEDKILDIITELGGDTYISGAGAGSRRYIKEEDFNKKDIKLIWQDFKDPIYTQLHGDFVPRMSVIDLLMNMGPESANII
jgi:hypothetical protein